MGLRRYAALAKRAGLIDTEHVVLYGPQSRPRRAESGLTEALVQLAQGAPADAAVVAQMMRALPPVELGVAAHLRRQVMGRVNVATYLQAGAVDASAASTSRGRRGRDRCGNRAATRARRAGDRAGRGAQGIPCSGAAGGRRWLGGLVAPRGETV